MKRKKILVNDSENIFNNVAYKIILAKSLKITKLNKKRKKYRKRIRKFYYKYSSEFFNIKFNLFFVNFFFKFFKFVKFFVKFNISNILFSKFFNKIVILNNYSYLITSNVSLNKFNLLDVNKNNLKLLKWRFHIEFIFNIFVGSFIEVFHAGEFNKNILYRLVNFYKIDKLMKKFIKLFVKNNFINFFINLYKYLIINIYFVN